MYQAAVFIHLASAIIWVGGSLFLALVLIPVLRRFTPVPGQPSETPTAPPDMLGSVARRFRLISWICIVLLVATGLYILPTRYGIGFADFFSLGGHFVGTLQVKVALVAIVIWLSVSHDFIIGPLTSRLLEEMRAGDPETVAITLRLLMAHMASMSKRLMGAMVLDRLDAERATASEAVGLFESGPIP